jgi:hypothetical protein
LPRWCSLYWSSSGATIPVPPTIRGGGYCRHQHAPFSEQLSVTYGIRSSRAGLLSGWASPGALIEGLGGLILDKDQGRVLRVGRAASAMVAPQCRRMALRGLFSCAWDLDDGPPEPIGSREERLGLVNPPSRWQVNRGTTHGLH